MNRRLKRGVICFFVLFLQFNAYHLYAQYVKLVWKPSQDPNISHYCIYRKTDDESNFSLISFVNYTDTMYVDDDIGDNKYLSYTVTAVYSYGNESRYSNIVEIKTTATPVELKNFSAVVRDRNVILEWSTATESNNYGFEIQRSINNRTNYEKIGFINGKGTTSIPQQYRFIDQNLAAGEYYYRLKQIDFNGDHTFSDIVHISVEVIDDFQLFQNYPNPFNSTTTILYNLHKSSPVELTIYNIKGQLIYNLIDEVQKEGDHRVSWQGINSLGNKVPSGIYFYKLKIYNTSKFRSMILIN